MALTGGQHYFFTVKAENGAGLFSDDSASNGQVAWFPVNVSLLENNSTIKIFPNPAGDNIYLISSELIETIKICDLSGRIVLKNMHPNLSFISLDISSLSKGCYLLFINEKYSANIVKY